MSTSVAGPLALEGGGYLELLSTRVGRNSPGLAMRRKSDRLGRSLIPVPAEYGNHLRRRYPGSGLDLDRVFGAQPVLEAQPALY